MRLLISLAWRNLWRNKRRTWITVGSVVFAVLLAMVLESMDRGSQEAMVRNVVQYSTGYVQVQDTLYFDEPNLDNSLPLDDGLLAHIEALDGVAYTVPRLESHALAAGAERTRVAYTLGTDPEAEHRFNGIRDRMVAGDYFTGAPQEVVIGSGLARSLALGVGDTLVLLGQGYQGMTAAGKFAVAGLVKHPVPELDERIVLMTLEDAQWLYSAYDLLSYVMVVPQRVERHRQVAATLERSPALEDLRVYTWEELQPELVRTVEFDQAGTLIFLLILYVVIAFGIFGTVLTMTLEREKEFGVLVSIGLHRWKLATVLFLESLIINFMGVLFGMVLALPIMLWFYHNPIPLGEDMGTLMAEYGLEAVLPFSMDPRIFTQQGIIIFCIAMVVVLYPMFRVLALNVLDAARK
jgi:putative ABC transport system permease protein